MILTRTPGVEIGMQVWMMDSAAVSVPERWMGSSLWRTCQAKTPGLALNPMNANSASRPHTLVIRGAVVGFLCLSTAGGAARGDPQDHAEGSAAEGAEQAADAPTPRPTPLSLARTWHPRRLTSLMAWPRRTSATARRSSTSSRRATSTMTSRTTAPGSMTPRASWCGCSEPTAGR